VKVGFRKDGSLGSGHDVGGRRSFDERDRLDIADIMIVAAIAPSPAAGDFEDREFFARKKLRGDRPVGRRRSMDEGRASAAAADHRLGVMGCEKLPARAMSAMSRR
jgi:hypothetical protein